MFPEKFNNKVALGKRPYVNVYGNDWNTVDGTCVRDYIHVMDVARGHSDAMAKLDENTSIGCKIYNLGIGAGLSVLEIVEAMEKVSGKSVRLSLCFGFCFFRLKFSTQVSKYSKDLLDQLQSHFIYISCSINCDIPTQKLIGENKINEEQHYLHDRPVR